MPKKTSSSLPWIKQPSWWIVVIGGVLFISFSVAIVRELINSHNVRQQVQRLHSEVAVEQKRQQQLQDLIDYLGSPTFQEQEARLQLGLKKSDEQVIVVPPNNSNLSTNTPGAASGNTEQTKTPLSHPQRWWEYFFGPRSTDSTTKA